MPTATVFDVAKYVLEKAGPMTAMKLQKLVYYAQAWSLVWDECALFDEKIEAWDNGPVVPVLYKQHKGMFMVDASLVGEADTSKLTSESRDTIDMVLRDYGQHTAQWLSDLSHSELPWKLARGEAAAGDRTNDEITAAMMHEYYSGLLAAHGQG